MNNAYICTTGSQTSGLFARVRVPSGCTRFLWSLIEQLLILFHAGQKFIEQLHPQQNLYKLICVYYFVEKVDLLWLSLTIIFIFLKNAWNTDWKRSTLAIWRFQPRHLQSGGLGETFVCVVRSVDPHSLTAFHHTVDNFLILHWSADDWVTDTRSVQLFTSRCLRFSFSCISSVDVSLFGSGDLSSSDRTVLARSDDRMATTLDCRDETSHKRRVHQSSSENGPSVVSLAYTIGLEADNR